MLPPAQVEILKKFFATEVYPSVDELTILAMECEAVCLGEMTPLSTKQIKDWFVRARLAQKRETPQLEGCDEVSNQENEEPEIQVAGTLGGKRIWLNNSNSRNLRAFSSAQVNALKKFFAEDAHPNSARLASVTIELNEICAAEKKKLSEIQVKSWFARERFAQKRRTLQLEGCDENIDVEDRKATKRQRSPSFDESDTPNVNIHQQHPPSAPPTYDEDYEPLMKKQRLGHSTPSDSLLRDKTPQTAEHEEAEIPKGYNYSWEKAFKIARDRMPNFYGRDGERFEEYLKAFEVLVLKNQHLNDFLKNEMLFFTVHGPARKLIARSHDGVSLARSLKALSTHLVQIPEHLKLFRKFEFDMKDVESSYKELKRILGGLAQFSGLKDSSFVGSLLRKLPMEFKMWKETLQTRKQIISPALVLKMVSRYFKVKY